MGLRNYLAKRRFGKTPEPKGGKPRGGKKLSFVVHEHHASRLHYDFRLELDGVLKSWAVPKGPSMDPSVHHLAVHVEDHPYDYRNFEGVIPEGNYGAGNVIIWDKGWYEARKGKLEDSEKTLRAELKKGHLTFILHGQKLKGEFALIQMHNSEDDKAWLLVKKGDEFATTKDVTRQDESVVSGLTVEEIGHAPQKEWAGRKNRKGPVGSNSSPEKDSRSPGERSRTLRRSVSFEGEGLLPLLHPYPKITKPWPVSPMLCTLVDEPFDGEDWVFEIKWDGFRAIGSKHREEVRLYSRNATDFREHYPPVAEALAGLEHEVIVDGEIVVTDDDGRPHFELLQNWRRDQQGHLYYYMFDLLWLDGHDIREMPLIERKKLLKKILPKGSTIRFSDHLDRKGVELFDEMQKRGLEGIVAKKSSSTYRENDRGSAWLKIKTHLRQEVVIGGFTEPRGGRQFLGSLIVGVYNSMGDFVYVGHSGGGIPDKQRKELRQKLDRLERKSSPFKTEPRPNAPVHWVRPELVCEMSFSEWTKEGYMRQPQFKGMRSDKKPSAVHREKLSDTKKARRQAEDK